MGRGKDVGTFKCVDENKIVIKRPLKRPAIKRFPLFHSRYSLPLNPPVNGEKVPHFIEPVVPKPNSYLAKNAEHH